MKLNSTILLTLFLFLSGCFSHRATITTKPTVDITPWEELSVRSELSGSTYQYMHLDGPTPDAPVMLLLHGGIFDERIWTHAHELSKKYHLFALQYPDNSIYYTQNVTDWGKVVSDFVATANLKPHTITAVSNGAYGAIEYLLQNRDHSVRHLVLISTVMFSISEEEVKVRSRLANFALSMGPDKLLGLIEKKVMKTDFENVREPGQKDIFYIRPYPYYFQLFGVPKNQKDRKQDTQSIHIPVLVLHGTDDETMPIRAAKLTPSVFEKATFIEMKGMGHDMVFSHGTNVTGKILEHFLN